MWMDSDAIVRRHEVPAQVLIEAGGLADESAFLLGGDDSPIWQVPGKPKLQGGVYLWRRDPRAFHLLDAMIAGAMQHPEFKKDTWPLDQHLTNVALDADSKLCAGVRRLPWCTLSGTDCLNSTISALETSDTPPYVYHCTHGGDQHPDSKDNSARALDLAKQSRVRH